MKTLLLLFGLLASSCLAQHSSDTKNVASPSIRIINPSGATIATRFNTPPGFKRIPVADGSFAAFLRHQALYSPGTPVRYFDGREKPNPSIYEAVLRLDRGTADLQQCADAVMRLRAEWLWHSGRKNDIAFNLSSGLRADYAHWCQGYRITIVAGKAVWKVSARADSSYTAFRQYLDAVYSYAGTRTLALELKSVDIREMQIGDVLIVGGAPGHAVTVMDMAINQRGEKLFMLSQSYMPAQDIQILCNNQQPEISPWYLLPHEPGSIQTPQWEFSTDDLKRFP